jgi:hypothetical protein
LAGVASVGQGEGGVRGVHDGAGDGRKRVAGAAATQREHTLGLIQIAQVGRRMNVVTARS